MALLWDASLTDAGVSMISQWAQGTGNKLTITGGVIGEGVVAATQLHALTQLTDQKSTISIQGFESVANGVKLKLRKTSQGITTSFILNQIGIYAKLDTSGGTPIIADSLIAVYQQDTGVLVPTEADSPDFVFTFYGTIQTNYQGDLTINVDTSALLSQDDIADDLVTADATMALSANMGRVLNEKINDLIPNNAGSHNRYRGKALTLNADFWAHISDGTFEDQFVGDTITLNGRTYTLAHANYWLHTGDGANECTTNHWVVISPNMGDGAMNNDDDTTGGYLGSGFRSGTNHDSTPNTAYADYLAIIKSDFGASHILSHRELLDNAITGGYPSAVTWIDSEAELMSQIMVYGNRFYDPSTNLGQTLPEITSIDKTQLALYAQSPDSICDRTLWWLRDVVSASQFALARPDGMATYLRAALGRGIRFAFGIKA